MKNGAAWEQAQILGGMAPYPHRNATEISIQRPSLAGKFYHRFVKQFATETSHKKYVNPLLKYFSSI